MDNWFGHQLWDFICEDVHVTSNVELRNYVPSLGVTQSNVVLRNYVSLFGVTQSNVDLRNYVISRQIVI